VNVELCQLLAAPCTPSFDEFQTSCNAGLQNSYDESNGSKTYFIRIRFYLKDKLLEDALYKTLKSISTETETRVQSVSHVPGVQYSLGAEGTSDRPLAKSFVQAYGKALSSGLSKAC